MNKIALNNQMQTVFPQITTMLSQLVVILPELAPQTRTFNMSLIAAQAALQTKPAIPAQQNANAQQQDPSQPEEPAKAEIPVSNNPAPSAPSIPGGEGLTPQSKSSKFRFVYAQQEEEDEAEAEAPEEDEEQEAQQPQEISPYDKSIQILEALSTFDMHGFWMLLQQALDFTATQTTIPAMLQVKQQILAYANALASYVERLNTLASSPRTSFIS